MKICFRNNCCPLVPVSWVLIFQPLLQDWSQCVVLELPLLQLLYNLVQKTPKRMNCWVTTLSGFAQPMRLKDFSVLFYIKVQAKKFNFWWLWKFLMLGFNVYHCIGLVHRNSLGRWYINCTIVSTFNFFIRQEF